MDGGGLEIVWNTVFDSFFQTHFCFEQEVWTPATEWFKLSNKWQVADNIQTKWNQFTSLFKDQGLLFTIEYLMHLCDCKHYHNYASNALGHKKAIFKLCIFSVFRSVAHKLHGIQSRWQVICNQIERLIFEKPNSLVPK